LAGTTLGRADEPVRVLFAVNETGSAAYFAPLLNRYLTSGHDNDCRYIAGPAAKRYLKRHDCTGFLVLEPPASESELRTRLASWSPELIVTSATGANLETIALLTGRSMGIPTASIIDIWMNYRWRFETTGGLVLPDLILVPDEKAKAEAMEDGIQANLIEVVGQPAWELALPLAPPDKRRTLFVGQPLAPAGDHDLGYTVIEAWDLVRETAERHPEYFGEVIYSVHPDQPQPDAKTLGSFQTVDNGAMLLPDVEIVLGMSSSLLVDALLVGRRVISVQPGAKGFNMDPLSRHGRIPRVGTSVELLAALEVSSSDSEDLRTSFEGSLDRLEAVLQKLRRGDD
jgi:hypothetical protein